MLSIILLLPVSFISFSQALSQADTHDASTWGTLDAPTYSKLLTKNPLPEGYPWGTAKANDSNPYAQAPNTGVTRHYRLTLSRTQKAPDGYLKNVILVNDQFSGPLIEANWGDWVEVQVTDNIANPEEGTTLHWHGLLQKATPWYDGTPSVQQCPIAPGSSFTADLYGTSWYRSHYSAQYAGSLLGPLIIHGPSNYDYDIDLGPVLLSDYYHKEYFQIVEEVEGTDESKWLQYSDNNLINGKMSFNCASTNMTGDCTNNAPLARFKFHEGKAYRLRPINTGAAGQEVFPIDGHELTVIANDYVPIGSYTTKHVFLGVGRRTDVVVQANGNARGAYWMRSNISTICNLPRQPKALAEVFYEDADTSQQPSTQAWPYTDNGKCNNDDLSITTPYYSISPSVNPAKTFQVVVDEVVNATGHLNWRLNEQASRGNYTNRYSSSNKRRIGHGNQNGMLSSQETVKPSGLSSTTTPPSRIQCTFTATTCTYSMKATASGTVSLSPTRTIHSVATSRYCDQTATLSLSMMPTTRACGPFTVTSPGILRWVFI